MTDPRSGDRTRWLPSEPGTVWTPPVAHDPALAQDLAKETLMGCTDGPRYWHHCLGLAPSGLLDRAPRPVHVHQLSHEPRHLARPGPASPNRQKVALHSAGALTLPYSSTVYATTV